MQVGQAFGDAQRDRETLGESEGEGEGGGEGEEGEEGEGGVAAAKEKMYALMRAASAEVGSRRWLIELIDSDGDQRMTRDECEAGPYLKLVVYEGLRYGCRATSARQFRTLS